MTITSTGALERPAVAWFLDALRARRAVSAAEVEAHFVASFVEAANAEWIAEGITKMAVGLKVVDPIVVEEDGAVRIPLSPTGGFAPYRVRLAIDADRLAYFDFGPMEIEGVELRAQPPDTLSAGERAAVHDVFAQSYRDGDHGYLDGQLATLGTIATAWADDGLAGFALSDARVVDLPRLPQQVVRTAGLSCVLESHRRKGVSSRLESLAMTGGDAPAATHTLLTSRFAHAAGLRHVRRRVDVVPRPGHVPSAWQRDVAAGVAAMLGVQSFDRSTFVCHGPGRPVGINVIDLEASDEELALFEPVDRSRGDTLLAVWWTTAPPGWDADR